MTYCPTSEEKMQEMRDGLVKLLDEKASALLLTGNSGSFAIAQLACAKQACRAAGISDEEISDVINAVSERRRL